ncbi:MAG: holo-ACP synthase [Thermoleophilia bacterium]|nr:holo-ACP synthase [Thermoleophilia bacterium]
MAGAEPLEPLLKIGVDLIEIERVRRALARHGESFKERCFTEAERAYCDSKPNPPQHYAGRFAAKEAVGKALGCGVHFTWKEIEVRGRPKPGVYLSGRTARFAEKIGAARIELSMTHARELAAAVAVVVE